MARQGGGFQFGAFTDPVQTQMFFDIMQQIFEPKVSRKARQTREALEKLVELRKQHGYQPELERQFATTYHYDPGLFRRLFRPSERQPELLFSPYEPETKIKQPKSGRTTTPPFTSPLPPPLTEPLLSPEHKKEITELAQELYPDDPEAQRDFFVGMVTKWRPTTEDKRYQAIGKVEEFIQNYIQRSQTFPDAGGESEEAIEMRAQKEAQRQMPRAFAMWKDFHLLKELQRKELESRMETREEKLKIDRARQRLAEERLKWQQQLAKSKDENVKAAQGVKNSLQAYNLAQKAWKEEMALTKAYRERQDKVTMEMFKLGYTDSPIFNIYDYQPEMSFREWLHTPSGSPWLELINRFGGIPTTSQPQPQSPFQTPPPTSKRPPLSSLEQEMEREFGFSPRSKRR